jgi:hypothetical protein
MVSSRRLNGRKRSFDHRITDLNLMPRNHLVKLFTFMLRNQPEAVMEGTGGSIEYVFETLDAITIKQTEMQFSV